MSETLHGPLLTDAELFSECINLDWPGMTDVRKSTGEGDWPAARRALASFIRSMAVPEGFFDITYEPPENIVTYPEETEEAACERIMDHTLISVGVPCAYGRENPVDWMANPTSNGYREWPYQLNRHHELKMLAHQYRLTGKAALAACAAELLASWLRQATAPAADVMGFQTLCWRTIEGGIRTGCTWPYAFYTFHDCPAFSDDVLVDWIKSYVEHGRRLSRNHMSGNWLIMEMNGLNHISQMLPFLKEAEAWKQQSFDSLTVELDRQLYPEGFQYELTTNYHNVIIINYQRMLNLCRVMGEQPPQALLDKLAPAIGFEHKLMMPDGTIPDINDGSRFRVADLMRARRDVAPDHPIVRWLADGDSACQPKETSMLLPGSGFAVMRTGWGPEDAWALLDAGPFGRAHQHEDKLNVLFYAHGKLFLTEGGNYAYDSSPMRSYVLDTASHNTVRVDGLPQNRKVNYRWSEEMIRMKAEGLEWHHGTAWDFAAGVYDESYGPEAAVRARHSRRAFFRREGEPLLIVVDRVQADEPHTFEWLWHIDSVSRGVTAECAAFDDADVAYSRGAAEVITGQEEPEWQGFVATGTKQGMYRPVPCLCVRAEANALRLTTVIAPRCGAKRLLSVHAEGDPLADTIRLVWSDGSAETLEESAMMKQG